MAPPDGGPERPEEAIEERAVAVPDPRRPGGADLVAGGDDADGRSRLHLELRRAGHGRHGEVRGREPRAPRDEDVPSAGVLPARAMFRPGSGTWSSATSLAPSCQSVRSIGTTVVPRARAPPVMIRRASPGSSRPSWTFPAVSSPRTVKRVRSPSTTTAKPSMVARSKPGWSRSMATSRARTRPRPSLTATDSVRAARSPTSRAASAAWASGKVIIRCVEESAYSGDEGAIQRRGSSDSSSRSRGSANPVVRPVHGLRPQGNDVDRARSVDRRRRPPPSARFSTASASAAPTTTSSRSSSSVRASDTRHRPHRVRASLPGLPRDPRDEAGRVRLATRTRPSASRTAAAHTSIMTTCRPGPEPSRRPGPSGARGGSTPDPPSAS